MRVSSRPGDPGYRRERSGLMVFLGGSPVFDCVVADEESGLVIVRERDANGRLKGNDVGLIETEKRGSVVIQTPSGAFCRDASSSARTARP